MVNTSISIKISMASYFLMRDDDKKHLGLQTKFENDWSLVYMETPRTSLTPFCTKCLKGTSATEITGNTFYWTANACKFYLRSSKPDLSSETTSALTPAWSQRRFMSLLLMCYTANTQILKSFAPFLHCATILHVDWQCNRCY